jgi:hypothetical protein
MDPVLQQAQQIINGSGLNHGEKGQLLDKCLENLQRAHIINGLDVEGLTETLRGMLPSGELDC